MPGPAPEDCTMYWFSTLYEQLGAIGLNAGRVLVSVTFVASFVAATPASAQTLAGCQMLPADNIWNTPMYPARSHASRSRLRTPTRAILGHTRSHPMCPSKVAQTRPVIDM